MPVQITYRSVKGTPLTNNEVDANFKSLADASELSEQTVATVKATADAAQVKLVAGTNISIDETDPANPVISASGGGGTGGVQTVAGIQPVEGDILTPTLVAALGIDDKVDKVSGKQLSTEDYTSAEKTKLGGVATGATANSPNATLLARANHTGTQLAATISDFVATVRGTILTGLAAGTNVAIAATDSVLVAFAKLQTQLDDKLGLTAKAADSDKLNGQLASFYTATMTGATATVAGTKGLVPAPSIADRLKVLSGAGAWVSLPSGGSWGSITGTLSAQTDLQAALDEKMNSAVTDFSIIYPNGGSASAPASIAANTRYITDNPFPGFHVLTQIEILVGSVWSDPGWDGNTGTGGNTYGAISAQALPADKVIVQTGTGGVMANSSLTGSGHGWTGGTVTTAPCRVKVWKVRGAI